MRGLGKKEKIEETGKIEESKSGDDEFKYHCVEILESKTEKLIQFGPKPIIRKEL